MKKPDMNCGECPYWLAYGESETSDEQNDAILKHCAECDACDGRCFNCDYFDSTTDKCIKESEDTE